MRRWRRRLGWLAAAGTLAVITGGCKKGTPTTAANLPPPASQARQLFDNKCARCHSLPGSPPPPADAGGKGGRMRGPDLTHVGADPSRTVDWIAAHIRNPKTHKPESRMPAFETQLQPAEIQAIAEMLAGMK